MLSVEIKINNKTIRQINIVNIGSEENIHQYHYDNIDSKTQKITRGAVYHTRSDNLLILIQKVIEDILEKDKNEIWN